MTSLEGRMRLYIMARARVWEAERRWGEAVYLMDICDEKPPIVWIRDVTEGRHPENDEMVMFDEN